jgi:hypothetical protein
MINSKVLSSRKSHGEITDCRVMMQLFGALIHGSRSAIDRSSSAKLQRSIHIVTVSGRFFDKVSSEEKAIRPLVRRAIRPRRGRHQRIDR